MANSQVTVRDTQLEKQRTGYINLNLTALTTTAVPDIVAGSVVEVGGSLYSFTVDETPTGWAGIANDTQAYIKLAPGASDVTSSFVTTAPTYSSAKGGWYSGDDRYVARVYKDASGNAVQKYVYPQDSEAGSVWDRFLDTLPWFTDRTVFTTSGTWTCPNDVHFIRVSVIGGGGGGGGVFCSADGSKSLAAGAGGGANGAEIHGYIKVIPGKDYTVTVGSGGSGASSGSGDGSDGGNSVFDTITAPGGPGGAGINHFDGGGTPTPSGGSVADPSVQDSRGGSGGNGESKSSSSTTVSATSGAGGSPSIRVWPTKFGELGEGGAAVTATGVVGDSTNGNSGTEYGASGSGGAAGHDSSSGGTSAAGGNGADGVVIVAY